MRAWPTMAQEDGVAEELADLILDGRNGFCLVLGFPGSELALPECPHDGIAEPAREHRAVGSVAEEPLEGEQGDAGGFEAREQGVTQDVLQVAAPTSRRRAS